MKRWRQGLTALILAGIGLLAGGCSSPPTRYYVLAPLLESAPMAGRELAVGVGPVELPDYLDRPQIVTRSGQNQLNLAEFDQWGEPLQDNVAQVLAEELAALLPSRKVVVHPWRRATQMQFQVPVKITRFDRDEGGDTVLVARWSLLDGDGRELLARVSHYREHPSADGYGATVAAMNRALARFSRDLAEALRTQPDAPAPVP